MLSREEIESIKCKNCPVKSVANCAGCIICTHITGLVEMSKTMDIKPILCKER